jgi:1,6-anhydro-N-acetylmuramate kinase
MDGVDACLLGVHASTLTRNLPNTTRPYPPDLRAALASIVQRATTTHEHYHTATPDVQFQWRGAASRRDSIDAITDADTYETDLEATERRLTEFHAEVVKELLASAPQIQRDTIQAVGFHGHTILHRPQHRITVQIGDGALLAHILGIPVVNDFRNADVRAGGQGAGFFA